MHFDAKITINFCAKFTSTFYAYYAIVKFDRPDIMEVL